MPLDSLIPIGGAPKSSSSSKRGGAGDLTSGLISISGVRDNADVDMSDFDVGDLLGDDSSKSRSRTKDKSDDKKKKKSKDKSSSSSKKKSKSKSKKSAFDDDDFGEDSGDNWTSSAKNWDSAAELEMAAAAAARKKNASGKIGGGMDDEFAKMLGLDSGIGEDFGTVESPPLSPEPVDEKADKFDSDNTFGVSGYTPTVRGGKKSESVATRAIDADESDKGGGVGISASFFQDDNKGDMGSTSLSSLLGPTTERRGGTRGNRRQTGSGDSDPFGFGSTAAPSSSSFDSLFGGSSSRRSALDDPFAKPAKDPPDEYNSRQQSRKDPIDESKPNDDPPVEVTPARDAGRAQGLSAKDDLLADLFSSEPRSSARAGRRREESTLSKTDGVAAAGSDDEKKTKAVITPEPTPTALPIAADPAKQQDDLLAELFTTSSSSKPTAREKLMEEEYEAKLKPAVVEEKSPTPPKRERTPPLEKCNPPAASSLPSTSGNDDLASARDSLLMDLLGDLSPPRPKEPVLSRRRSRSNINGNSSSPEKEVVKAEDPFKRSPPPSPIQTKPLATVPEVPESITTSSRPATPPSPGQRRTLTVDKGALAIRESDFEQSKDSLLEEILPSSPSISARSSPHRRNSYSQSFDVEDSIVANVTEEQASEAVEEQKPQTVEEPPAPNPPSPPVVNSPPPPQHELKVEPKVQSPPMRETPPPQPTVVEEKAVLAPACNCEERAAKLTAAFELERATLEQALHHKIDELSQQLEAQVTSSSELTQQLTQQLEERESTANQLSEQLKERAAANAQLTQQLAIAERDKLQADQLAATSKDDAANYQHRAELLEAELRAIREELSRSKRAVQDAELALARKIAEQDEADRLEHHREKRALEALSAQMQRALARLTISHQVQEEGPGYDNSAARVAAEDEARLRVIASLEGSSKRAAQHAEQERTKLAELLRELEAGTRNARQGALEDKERLRQEQQRLDALSAHLQAQAAALREQEATHAAYMGKHLAEAREDARVYDARLATRRTQLERDERALYEARAEFAAFREQTALEIEREHEQLRVSRLALEDAWRELRADREDLETELASHDDEFQALESMRREVQQAETRLAERTQEVVALAEKLDAGTRDLLEREQLVAQQAAVVQDTDTSFTSREKALERVKHELEAREQRLHVQIRQLDGARGRLTQQRREQQQLMAAARRQYSTAQQQAKNAVDNNKLWRRSEFTSMHHHRSNASNINHNDNTFNHQSAAVDKHKIRSWEAAPHIEEDPSGLSPALRKQVEANWQRRNQQIGQRRQGSRLSFDLGHFDATSAMPSKWSTKTMDVETSNYSTTTTSPVRSTTKASNVTAQQKSTSTSARMSPAPFNAPQRQPTTSTPPPATNIRTGSNQPPPPPLARSVGKFQPTLRVNL